MNYPPEDVGDDCSTREGLTIFVFDFNRTINRNRNDYYAIAMVRWIAPRWQYSRWRPTQWITCFDCFGCYCDSFCTACTLRTCAHGLAAIWTTVLVTGYRKRLTEVTKRSIPLRSMCSGDNCFGVQRSCWPIIIIICYWAPNNGPRETNSKNAHVIFRR